jgi:hypothetical protein
MLQKLLIVMFVSLLSGYVSAQEGPSSEQILGAIAGGALGSTIGDGDGRKAATVVGAIIGYRMGDRMLNPNPTRNFRPYKTDYIILCRRHIPYEYQRREHLRNMWMKGCLESLTTQQRHLGREAYEDGLRYGPTN